MTRWSNRAVRRAGMITLVVVAVALGGCGKKKPADAGKGGGRKFPVEASPVEARELRYRITAVGTLEASDVISVTSRVAGVAEKVSFREGEIATPERVLVEIEPDRFRLAVSQAKANLARAEATAQEAAAALAKREQLREKDPGWVSAEELSTFRSRLDVTKAEVEQAKAAVELADLNLRDALVRAGASGVLQKRLVQPGQYVAAGTPLAILVRSRPLFLRFKVAEREAVQLRTGMRAEFEVRADVGRKLAARIVLVGDTADPKTRMVECLARVESDDPRLRPGFFAEVSITTGVSAKVPVVPEGAIKPTEKGFVVFVVEDGKAIERVVDPGLRTEDGNVEIRSGVVAGEMLVTRGAQYLRAGVPVEVKAP